MKDLELICPHCSQRVEAARDMLGKTIECPQCNGWLTLPLVPPTEGNVPPVPRSTLRPTHPLATTALALGVVSYVTGPFGIVLAVPAVVFGEIAYRRIRQAPAAYGGAGIAMAGRIAAYLYIVIWVLGMAACSRFF